MRGDSKFASLLLLCFAVNAYGLTAGPLIQVSSTNLLSGCSADDVGAQPGTNYPNSEVECWLDVNPVNSNNVVAVWQQDRWSDGGSRGIVSAFSTNAGVTWEPVALPGTSLCTGGTLQRGTDPWLSFSPAGDLFAITLSLDADQPGGGFGRNAILVSKSTDGGMTWSLPVSLREDDDANVLNDKESITADPTDAHFVYAVWDRLASDGQSAFTGPTYFARSTDAGETWETASVLLEPGKNRQTIGNQILVLPDGRLINICALLGVGRSAAITLSTSEDKGINWRPRRGKRVQRLMPGSVFDPKTGTPLRTSDLLPAVAVDRGRGAIYAVWQDVRFSNHVIDEIAFSQSLDGGRHWSKPVKINQTPPNILPGNRQAFLPSIRVAADGTIGVTYYDFRFNDAGADLKTDVFLAVCRPSAETPATNPGSWTEEIRLTDSSFDFRTAPVVEGGYFLGDYGGLAVDGSDFLAMFAKTHDQDPGSVFFRRVTP
jgi:hypothetical protein